jgi:hypothetical protein
MKLQKADSVIVPAFLVLGVVPFLGFEDVLKLGFATAFFLFVAIII